MTAMIDLKHEEFLLWCIGKIVCYVKIINDIFTS